MPRKAASALSTSVLVSTLVVAFALSGCATPTSEPGAVETTVATTGPDASSTPLPTTTPPAPATAPTAEAPPAWDACIAAVRDEYPDLPFLDDVWSYEADDVRDSATGAVVEVRYGHTTDGRIEAAFSCEISGTPEAPVVDRISPVDI